MYNLTALQNETSFLELIEVINTSTNGWLIGIILISLFVILFIAMKRYETLTALRTASFITTIVASLFFILNWISGGVFSIPVVILLFTIFWGIVSQE